MRDQWWVMNGPSKPEFAIADLRHVFEVQEPNFKRLLEEVSFCLEEEIRNAEIKIHEIEKRIKSFDSLVAKAVKREFHDPIAETNDIVGTRVVCLFRSDIEKLEVLVSKCFRVIERDDKISETTDSFGYMSVHYICQMHNHLRGPRYDALKGQNFEIQLRTISMHAWAVISHYLDYIGTFRYISRKHSMPSAVCFSLPILNLNPFIVRVSYQKNERLQKLSPAHRSKILTLTWIPSQHIWFQNFPIGVSSPAWPRTWFKN